MNPTADLNNNSNNDELEQQTKVQEIYEILELLLNFDVVDHPQTLYQHVLLLEGYRKKLSLLGSDTLLPVLNKLFAYVEYIEPGTTYTSEFELSEETQQLRRRALHALVEICSSTPDLVVPCFNDIYNMCSDLMGNGSISSSSKAQIYEMLTVIILGMEDFSSQTSLLSDILSDPTSQWTSDEMRGNLLNESNLLDSLGLNDPAGPDDLSLIEKVSSWVSNVLSTMNIFLSVSKRISDHQKANQIHSNIVMDNSCIILDGVTGETLEQRVPLLNVWVEILPNIIILVNSIHSLWSFENRAYLLESHPYGTYVLAMNEDEILSKCMVGGQRTKSSWSNKATTGVSSPKSSANESLRNKWPLWLNQLRSQCYGLLEQACFQKVIYLQDDSVKYLVQDVGVEGMLGNQIESMEHRHLSWFIRLFLEAYVLNCPINLLNTHVAPLLTAVMSHCMLRCSIIWATSDEAIISLQSQAGSNIDVSFLISGGLHIPDPESINASIAAQNMGDDAQGLSQSGTSASISTYDTVLDKVKRDITRVYMDFLRLFFGVRGEFAGSICDYNHLESDLQAKINMAKAMIPQIQDLLSSSISFTKCSNVATIIGASDTFSVVSTGSNISIGGKSVGSTIAECNQQMTHQQTKFQDISQLGFTDHVLTRRLAHYDLFLHGFVLLEESIVFPLLLTLISALSWQDSISVTHSLGLCNKLISVVFCMPSLQALLGQGLFPELVNALLYPTKWLQGCEWEIVNCLVDIYRTLVLSQPSLLESSPKSMRQNNPINESPRATLLQFVNIDRLDEFEKSILDSKTVKDMRESCRELFKEIRESLNLSNNDHLGKNQSTSSIQNLSERIFSKGLQYMKNVDSRSNGGQGNDGLANGNLLDLFGDNNI